MIALFEEWAFAEFILDDGAGAISDWKQRELLEEEHAVFDAFLLNFRHAQQWSDVWNVVRFEELATVYEIPLPPMGAYYKIFGTRENLYRFVMLAAVKGRRVPKVFRDTVKKRIGDLRANRRRIREYQIV